MVRKLFMHGALYALVLAALTAIIPLDSSFGSDDGAYGGQVYALQQGAWALERPLPVVAQPNEGWLNTAITPDGPTPYTANPAYALLLQGAAAMMPSPRSTTVATAGNNALGLQLLPVVGALVSACLAWSLARRWSERAAPLAFWLMALGPLLVNSTTLWAHTLSTALGGLAVIMILSIMEPAAKRFLLGMGLTITLVAASAIRTESLLWLAALAALTLAVDRSRRTLLLVGPAGGLAVLTWLLNRAWGQSLRADKLPIETSVEALRDQTGWLAGRLPAAWQLLMTAMVGGVSAPLILIATMLALYAGVKLKLDDDGSARPLVNGLLIGSAALHAVRLVLEPGELITGTISAWPTLVVLLLAGSTDDQRTVAEPDETGAAYRHNPPRSETVGRWPSVTVLAVPVGVHLSLVVATQYAGSGGLQWGGRYLSMAFVPLAVLAAVRGHGVFEHHRPALSALLVVPAVAGAVASYELHSTHRSVIETVTRQPSDVVITNIVSLPRIAWPALPTAFYLATDDDLDDLLARFAEADVERINVVGFADVEEITVGAYALVDVSGQVRAYRLETNETG